MKEALNNQFPGGQYPNTHGTKESPSSRSP